MKKVKGIMKIIAGLAILILIALILLFWPSAATKVANALKVPITTFNSVLGTVVGGGIGLVLIHFGVLSLAVPWIGATLIIIGLALLVYAAWPWFGSSTSSSTGPLNKIQDP